MADWDFLSSDDYNFLKWLSTERKPKPHEQAEKLARDWARLAHHMKGLGW